MDYYQPLVDVASHLVVCHLRLKMDCWQDELLVLQVLQLVLHLQSFVAVQVVNLPPSQFVLAQPFSLELF
jgi:hypothetical protein